MNDQPLPPPGPASQREQRAESDAMGGAGLGFTPAQTRGIAGGGVVGGVVGAILFLPLGFIDIGGDLSAVVRFVVAAIIGFLAGAAVGAVFFGGRQPEIEGEAQGTVGVGTDTTDVEAHRRVS